MKQPISPESQEQIAFVNWFRSQFPKELIFAIPNGAFLSGSSGQRAAQMARLKAEGLTPGIPDLFIPARRLFVEMKRTKGGRISEVQAERITYLRAAGYDVIVAYGWDDARIKLGVVRA